MQPPQYFCIQLTLLLLPPSHLLIPLQMSYISSKYFFGHFCSNISVENSRALPNSYLHFSSPVRLVFCRSSASLL